MEVCWTQRIYLLSQVLMVWVTSSYGIIRCDCNTQECKDSGKTTCVGTKTCYTELYQNNLQRGCDPTPLACENRRPLMGEGVEWPALYCCNHKDLCNKFATPIISTPGVTDKDVPVDSPSTFVPPVLNCSDAQHRTSQTRIINPIYIAVPVAGVCVLLALVIFAMYLLRRRTDYHHDSSYYHEHATNATPKQNVAPHHCQCLCKKQTVPPCTKGNRCTDSERSSSGSETKFFLQS
ncbi:uncharacterized protein LOC131958200 [Physella acuta]|uniref:uncharacterized protein LOC131958200 n=1 Tax=Physella acuta TaxID=109671 RepID=UPI0027DCA038|nr:uncharacterized protein LOC131958200 [Physella acuta]